MQETQGGSERRPVPLALSVSNRSFTSDPSLRPMVPEPMSPTVRSELGDTVWTVVGSIAFYMLSTLVLLIFSKWFFSFQHHFVFVLTTTWLQSAMSTLLILAFRHPLQKSMGSIDFAWDTFWRVFPVGALACGDFSLSNVALQRIPMTSYQMVKSVAPAFVMMTSIAMRLIHFNWTLCGIIVTIVAGALVGVVGGGGGETRNTATNVPAATHPAVAHLSRGPTAAAREPSVTTVAAVATPHRVEKNVELASAGASSSSLGRWEDAALASLADPLVVGYLFILLATFLAAVKTVVAQIVLRGHRPATANKSGPGVGNSPSLSAADKGYTSGQDSGYTSGVVTPTSRTTSPTTTDFRFPTTDVDRTNAPVNPLTATYFVSLTITVLLFPVVWLFEGAAVVDWYVTTSVYLRFQTFALLAASSLACFCVSLSSFLIMKHTSAVTFAVVSIFERVLVVGTAMIVLGERMRFVSYFGFALTLVGVAWYNYYKIVGARQAAAAAIVTGERPRFSEFERKHMSHRKTSYSTVGFIVGFPVSPRMAPTRRVWSGVSLRGLGGGVENTSLTGLSLPDSVRVAAGRPPKYGATESSPNRTRV